MAIHGCGMVVATAEQGTKAVVHVWSVLHMESMVIIETGHQHNIKNLQFSFSSDHLFCISNNEKTNIEALSVLKKDIIAHLELDKTKNLKLAVSQIDHKTVYLMTESSLNCLSLLLETFKSTWTYSTEEYIFIELSLYQKKEEREENTSILILTSSDIILVYRCGGILPAVIPIYPYDFIC